MLALKAILLLALLHEGNCQCGKLGTWYCEGSLTWVVGYHAGFHVLTLFNSSLRARQIWEDRSGLRGTSDSPECYRSRWQDSSYRRRRECDQGRDWLAGWPDRIKTKEQQSSLCLLRRHTPQREVDHDSSPLHRWVRFLWTCKFYFVGSFISLIWPLNRQTATKIWILLGMWNKRQADYEAAIQVAE